MRILLVTGIWPPDVGGPATHMPEVADYLHAHGHAVAVITTARIEPDAKPYPVEWISRSLPPGARHLALAGRIAQMARRFDVVYATSVPTRAALGASLARTPLVLKLTTDDAFERALRRQWFAGNMDKFQEATGLRIGALRTIRTTAVRRSCRVVCPSTYLAELSCRWGLRPESIIVIPNAGPRVDHLVSREEARRGLRVKGAVLVFAGRIGPQKALDVALEALARVADVTLLIAGEGPNRVALQARAAELGLNGRAVFLGPHRHERVLQLLRAADASLLCSDWENAPHGVVESLAAGTPVIATSVGGIPELVESGVNGLLVPPRDPAALADAIGRLVTEPGLRDRLAANAPSSVSRFAPDRVLEQLAQTLVSVATGP